MAGKTAGGGFDLKNVQRLAVGDRAWTFKAAGANGFLVLDPAP